MSMVAEYGGAQHDEQVARVRRVVALRAMRAAGMTQREIAGHLAISQPAVSQQLAVDLRSFHPELIVEAAAPILRSVAAEHGYGRIAVFGSVARGQARIDSDIDLLVETPPGASSFAFVRFRRLLGDVLGREVDLVDYAGLTPRIDDDIVREAVAL